MFLVRLVLSNILGSCDYYSEHDASRICRVSNIAVGSSGDIFIAEDERYSWECNQENDPDRYS